MDLRDFSLWLVELEAAVGRCKLALHAKPGYALCLQVEWENKGVTMCYEHTLSGIEMKRTNAVFHCEVMEQIKCKVIDMHQMHNASLTCAGPAGVEPELKR
jgi:hypothetical protein